MHILSVCSGIGALDEGVRLAVPKARLVAAADVYKPARDYLALRGVPRVGCDLMEVADVRADIITAGFPCQPWSRMGKGEKQNDRRWLWPRIARLLARVRPAFAFFENAAELRTGGGLATMLRDLAFLGFDAEWSTLQASAVGAPHGRDRLWTLAYSDRRRLPELRPSLDNNRGHAFRDDSHGRRQGLFPPPPPAVGTQAGDQPWIFSTVDGVAARNVWLRLLGNAVVPLAAAYALRALAARALGRHDNAGDSR